MDFFLILEKIALKDRFFWQKTAKTAFNTESKLQTKRSKYDDDVCKCVEDTLEVVNQKLVGREKFKVKWYILSKLGKCQNFWSNLGFSNQSKKI